MIALPREASDDRGSVFVRADGAAVLVRADVGSGSRDEHVLEGKPLAVGLDEDHALLLLAESLRLIDRETRAVEADVPIGGERRFLATSRRGVAAVGTDEGVFLIADGGATKTPLPVAARGVLDPTARFLCVATEDELLLLDVATLAIASSAPLEGELVSIEVTAEGAAVAGVEDGDAVEVAAPSRKRSWPALAALALAGAVIVAPLAKPGIWDPHELDAAELARRISQHLGRGAAGAEPMPTLGDLRSGELPFTSMALGFKLLGLRDWAGRLPLALWALAGATVAFFAVRRLVGARAAAYTALALAASPLFFVAARTMLGDAVTMGASLGAFAALVAAFGAERRVEKAVFGALGCALLGASFLSRGWLLGVAPVALAAGVAPLLVRPPLSPQKPNRARDAAAAALVAVGLYASARGLRLLADAEPGGVVVRGLALAVLAKPEPDGTFDLPIRTLGHGLFPLSALLPLAFGRLLRPPTGVFGEALARETLLRVGTLVALGTSFGVYALAAPRTGVLAFAGVGFLALALALVLADLDRGAPASAPLAIGTAALAFVLYRDLTQEPARTLAAFAVSKPLFPQGFEAKTKIWVTVATVPLLFLASLAWLEQPAYVGRSIGEHLRLRLARARAAVSELVTIWDGNLFFALVVVEAALVGLGGMVFVGRKIAWAPTLKMSDAMADLSVNLWWAVPLAGALAPVLFVAAKDALRLVVARTGVGQGGATMAAVVAAGLVLGLGYYPALGAQLSPKEAFDAYARLHKDGEPLAVLGVRQGVARYYGAAEVEQASDPSSAFAFLGEGGRRWLVLRADDLPRVNSLHRRRSARNLPVLDASSSLVLLASSDLAGAPNVNPLGDVVLDEPRAPRHRLDAALEDSLDVLGWELTDEKGAPVDSVVPQKPFRVRVYYRVTGPVTGAWKGFLHVDKPGLRHTADHPLTDGRYPAALWQVGDRIVDTYVLILEPNFVPGDYPIYFGLFAGETRMQVSRGPNVENRVAAGNVRVR